MFKNETELKRFYKSCFFDEMRKNRLDFWSIEHGQGGSVGLPDLVHPSKDKGNVYFGLEFKQLTEKKPHIILRPEQVGWHYRENRAGNKTFVIVGCPEGILILNGAFVRYWHKLRYNCFFEDFTEFEDFTGGGFYIDVLSKEPKKTFYSQMSRALYG